MSMILNMKLNSIKIMGKITEMINPSVHLHNLQISPLIFHSLIENLPKEMLKAFRNLFSKTDLFNKKYKFRKEEEQVVEVK
jgi:hypothetical protein